MISRGQGLKTAEKTENRRWALHGLAWQTAWEVDEKKLKLVDFFEKERSGFDHAVPKQPVIENEFNDREGSTFFRKGKKKLENPSTQRLKLCRKLLIKRL